MMKSAIGVIVLAAMVLLLAASTMAAAHEDHPPRLFLPLLEGKHSPSYQYAGIAWPHEDTRARGEALRNIGAKVTFSWSYDEERIRKAVSHSVAFYPMQWGCRGGEKAVNMAAVQEVAHRWRGLTWLAFNEPDVAGQANCTPEEAARAFHALARAIRTKDPWARIFCCGTAFYPAHMEFHEQWAEAYKRLYGRYPPFTGFHIHSYASYFYDRFNWHARQQELKAFHEWQQERRWARGKPVIISEWAVLTACWWKDDQRRIAEEYIPQMMGWFARQRWIEAHIWFSTWFDDCYYGPSNIFLRDSDELTIVGKAWRDEVW